MSQTEDYIKQRLKQAFWDYNYSSEQLYALLYEGKTIDNLSMAQLYTRLLETYSWYKMMDIVPQNQWFALLSDDIIGNLRSEKLSQRYRHVKRILHRATVPLAG